MQIHPGATAMRIGDVYGDGDGWLEIALANGIANPQLDVEQKLPGTSILARADFPNPIFQRADDVVIGDFNADGRPDMAQIDATKGTLLQWLRQADGRFFAPPPAPFASGHLISKLESGDLDGDGRMDIAGLDTDANTVDIRAQTTPGVLAAARIVALPNTAVAPNAIALGDLDGDGDLDIAVLDAGSSSVYVLTNGPSGFTASTAGTTGASPNALAIGDLNGDGKPDLVTSDASDVTALLHDASGSGYTATTFTVPSPASVTIGDSDHDGRQDVITTSAGSSKLNILLNTTPTHATLSVSGPAGGGSFGAPTKLTATVTPDGGGPKPPGAVRFTIDGKLVSSPQPVGNDDTATWTVRGLGVGPHTIQADYIDDERYQSTSTSTTYTVGATRTITGTVDGPIAITEPTLIKDATITGDITIESSAGALDVESSKLVGDLDLQAAGGVRMCASTVVGDMTVQGAEALTVIGDADGSDCAVNALGGRLTLGSDSGGVRAIGNSIAQLAWDQSLVGGGMLPGQLTSVTGNLPAPELSLPPAGALPDTVVAGTSSQTLTITNDGSAALHVAGVTVEGGDGQFALGADSCLAGAVGPAGTCTVEVRFTPAAAGAQSATLRIDSDTVGAVSRLAVAGKGLRPGAVRLSATSLAFPDTEAGATSAAQTLTVTNGGEAPLQLAGDSLTGDFRIVRDGCGTATLAPGASCSLDVAFAPASGGAKSASLRIDSSSPSSPDLVALSGTGVLTPQVEPHTGPPSEQPPAGQPAEPPATGKPAFSKLKAGKKGALSFTLALPSAGRYTITTTAGKQAFSARHTGTTASARSVAIKLTPTAAGKRALKKAKKLKLTVKIAFTPAGGKAITITKTLTVKG